MNELVQVKFRYLTALLQLGKGSVKRLAAFLVMVFLSAAPLIAQENPIYLTNVEGILFFYSSNPVNGLWRSDGTDAGTVLVKNINASHLTRVGRSLYFIADNNLWKSDGTAEGTVQVKSFITSANIPFHQLTDVNGVLYFYLETSVGTYELWKSNGTEAGTVMLKQFMYPPEQFAVSSVDQLRLVNGNGTLYFTAQDTTYGWELWKSDGSSAGTVLVKDIRPGVNSSAPNGLFYWNGSLYFAANDGSAAGRELWKSNGTAEGTVLVKDIAPAIQGRFGTLIVANSNPAEFTIFQGSLYFAANSSYNQFVSSQDRELWKTDGTAEGTVLVKDIAPGGAGSYPSYLTVVNGTLFFGADKEGLPEPGAGFINQELWKSDGTTAGTVLVKDFPSSDFYFTALVNMNGTLFFTFGGFSSFDRELWKSNGTAEGTVQVKDIHPNGEQLNPSSPAELTVVNNTLFFSAFDGTGRHLWKSDGTEAGTVKVKSANSATACSATGSILREYWAGIPGTALSAIPLNTTPATSTQLTSFEAPTNVGDNYGQRIRGYICAPLTGQYFFAIASDDDSELWLSTDEDPANKVKIASVSGWTNPREWTKYPSQFSQTIDLEAGKKYYIEALHKEGAGGDNLAVAWQTPSSSLTVISGTYLSPFIPEPMCTASGSILREYWANIPGTSISSIPLNTGSYHVYPTLFF
jgi:ELWxxDGT repeat protein